jgi:hypothetical protein
MARVELKHPTLNPLAADYTPQAAQPILPETNPQTHIRENTNYQLNPLAAKYMPTRNMETGKWWHLHQQLPHLLSRYLSKNNTRGHIMGGVCIILSPTFNQAHNKSRKEIIKIETGKIFEGRLIGVPCTFPNVDDNGGGNQRRTRDNIMLDIPPI